MNKLENCKNFKFDFNFADTEKHLKGIDPNPNTKFVFQTFDDRKSESMNGNNKRPQLTRVIYGTLEASRSELERLNRNGAGIFVTINATKSGRRKKRDVVAIRGYFADLDGVEMKKPPLEPSLVIESKRGRHPYYLANDGEPVETFSKIQTILRDFFDSDPAVKDSSRVMRLAGFFHMKDPESPFLVAVKEASDRRYSSAEISNAFLIEQKSPVQNRNKPIMKLEKFRKWAEMQPKDEGEKNCHGGRNSTVMKIARRGLSLGVEFEVLSRIVQTYCDESGLPLEEGRGVLDKQMTYHQSSPFISIESDEEEDDKKKKEPYVDIAERYLGSRMWISKNDRKLRFYQGDFYKWEDGRYWVIPDGDLNCDVMDFLQKDFQARSRSTSRTVKEVIANLKGMLNIVSEVQVPSFENGTDWIDSSQLSFKNGRVDGNEIVLRGSAAVLDPTPRLFNFSQLTYEYDLSRTCPTWISFLNQSLPDRQTQEILQEWIGSHFSLKKSLEAKYQKFALFQGEGANGKSVVCNVMRCLLGFENISAVPLEAFDPTRTFPLFATLGKIANIVEEIGETDKAAEGLLKDFVSGAMMTIERKHRDAFNMRPTARLTFATNNLPRFSDRTDGLWRRLLLIPFRVQILDESKQNRNLVNPEWWIESGELPGVFNWAMEGLRRLLTRGRFLEAEESLQAKVEFRNEFNPARGFLRDHCVLGPEKRVSSRELYTAYARHVQDDGLRALGHPQFSMEVKREFPQVTLSANPKHFNDGRSREWGGVDLI